MKTCMKILMAPLAALISAFVWICTGVISASAWVFRIASVLIAVLGLTVLLTYSIRNGVILLVIAFFVSPAGLPMLAVHALGGLQSINRAIKF